MSYTLEVTVTAANFKRMDPEAYGIGMKERKSYLALTLGDQKKNTVEVDCPTLDPTWEEIHNFTVTDPQKERLTVAFFLGGKQIGNVSEYTLNALKKNVPTFKGMPVMGGKADLLLRGNPKLL
eukprot:TRINITY_DN2473_c0_g1_i2.p1 TRINITY_DN2473_c0_g1~~TRINITY_DN2473_c0_g1_i2.p1  ORF type:complete len:123 (-),score=31.00 TRINITY_DN2473_c0_g1_i2:164-532(-)